ncbi:MAG: sulfatase-like hydrolase/transferase [Planctomycetota bacterium]|jgi:choline-sulfatase
MINRRNFLKTISAAAAAAAVPSFAIGQAASAKHPGNVLKTIGAVAAAATAPSFTDSNAASGKKPNLLFLFADDQCYEALSIFGSEVRTPNLDKLVRNGVTFTHAYNQGAWGGAVCIASRTMLNTGRFLWNAHSISPKQECANGRLWPQYLDKAGYDTYFTGKWHLKVDPGKAFGLTKDVRPGMPKDTKQGYNRPIEGQPDTWSPWDRKFGGYWEGGKHWSEVLGDNSIEFLQQASKRKNPFFMYLAFNAPHDPRQSPKEYVDRYPLEKIKVPDNFLPEYPYKDAIGCSKKLRDEKLAPFPRTEYAIKVNRQEYYAIITHMDDQIGRILNALKKSGKADNTYIFFTADHGLAVGHHGLVGKQNMFEHSVRPPLIINGPGLTKNLRIDTPVYLQDIMPTTLELAQVPIPEHVQFKSLKPLLEGKDLKHYDAIYGGYTKLQRMVRKGDYKLIYYPKIKKVLLFNLAEDPQEMVNLATKKEYATVIEQLKTKLRELQKQQGDTLVIE